MSSGGYAASQRYAREEAERFSISFKEEIKGGGLPVAALVSIENGCLIKRKFPAIYNPEKEILKNQREIEKYTNAVERKDRELAVLRADENYTEITTAANYRREYQGYVDRATMRLVDLKKRAPERIQLSILEAEKYADRLKEEIKKAQAIIADAEKLKKQYEA